MIEINKKYWLYIAPHVYCCMKNSHALLYNTQSGERMETGNQDIFSLLQLLHEKKNLGTICCEGQTLRQSPYHEFINEFCNKNMGNLIDVTEMPEKPIQLMPILNLQRDIEKLQKERERNTGENILQYLLTLNIYLYTACNLHCPFCNDYFRQNLCCRKNHDASSETLDISILQNILSQIRHGVVGKLNLLGGNLFEYPHYKELSVLLSEFKGRVHIWNHYANFTNCKAITSDFQYDIPVTFPLNKSAWKYCISLLKNTQVRYHFYITGVTEYEEMESLVVKYGICNYALHPIYIESNQAFFEEYVYANNETIFQMKQIFRQIFAHQKLNTHFFGSLTILANGYVYANVNNSVLGNIIKGYTLLDIIDKEMRINTAWRKIRDTAPCTDCLYQYLCPSPSNYEIIIGKPDLCHVK